MEMQSPLEWLAARVARVMGSRVEFGRPVSGGYTPATRWSVTLADGRRAFVKGGADSPTSPVARWLRLERRAYEDIAAPYMAAVLGWDDDGNFPLLILEDLSLAAWPPPWNEQRIAAVRVMLETVARTPAPAWAEDLESRERVHLSGWRRVQQDPGPFLSLGLCDGRWLRDALPALIASGASAALGGDSLVHLDVRSDNMCFVPEGTSERAVLIDWNWCGRGNADLDLMLWLPSLHAEGGPPPWESVADSQGLAALISGYFAAQAGLPPSGGGPRARQLQLSCLRSALPWAIRELSLPTPPAER